MDRSQEVALKLEAVREWLARENLGAVAFNSQTNFAWITGGGRSHVATDQRAGVATIVVTPEHVHLVTTNIELTRMFDEEVDRWFEPIQYPWHEPDEALRVIEKLSDGGPAVGDLIGLGLPPAPAGLLELRRVLLPSEVDRYRSLGRDAAEAVEATCREAQPGMSEFDIAGRLAGQCARRGIDAIVNLVAADERIEAYRHPLPTDNRLRWTLFVALTGRRQGLHASLTRMVTFGGLEPHRQRRHRSVCLVDAALIAASRPGASLGEILRTAVDRYSAEGFPGEWERHHQGGLTGYAGREVFATPSSSYRLGPSQALAWNPSITGVKSEDTVVIDESGFEVLTRSGSWPEQEIHIGGFGVPRPTILVTRG